MVDQIENPVSAGTTEAQASPADAPMAIPNQPSLSNPTQQIETTPSPMPKPDAETIQPSYVQQAAKENSNWVDIYNIQSQNPTLGKMHPEDVHGAVASGQYSFPAGNSVPVVSPDGQLGHIPA